MWLRPHVGLTSIMNPKPIITELKLEVLNAAELDVLSKKAQISLMNMFLLPQAGNLVLCNNPRFPPLTAALWGQKPKREAADLQTHEG